MKNFKPAALSILFIFSLSLLFSFTGCSKKQGPSLEGIIILSLGKADIISGEKTVPAAVGIKVQKGDTITCAAGGFITIQVSDIGVIKILENTKVKFVELFGEKKGELYLSGGQVLSKISKLKKGDSFSVKTPTTVASVRGTEFSTAFSAESQKAVVAVKQGKVAVSVRKVTDKVEDTVPEDKLYTEKAVVEAGRTADIEAVKKDDKSPEMPAVELREISANESLTIQKVSIVPIIENVDKKTKDEIDTLTKSVIEQEIKIDADLMVKGKEEKIKKLIAKKSASIEEIKEAFDRIDEITLYNGRVVRGAIITRGKVHTVLTSGGTVTVKEGDIKSVKVLK